jgi:hypothetical protein
MPEKNNMFSGFSPEKGSKDEEDQRVANLEKHQEIDEELSGVSKKENWNETSNILEKQEREEEQIYIKRARLAGDKRSVIEISYEWEDLQDKKNRYLNEGTHERKHTSAMEEAADFMRSNVKSFADYLEKRQKDDNNVELQNIYSEWLGGKDFE